MVEDGATVSASTYSVGYTYDESGKRTSITYPSTTLTYNYEDEIALESITMNGQNIIDYERDPDYKVPTQRNLWGNALRMGPRFS